MSLSQPAILHELSPFAIYLEFQLGASLEPGQLLAVLAPLAAEVHAGHLVLGLGPKLARALESAPAELREFPDFSQAELCLPSTQADLWLWVRGEERLGLSRRAARYQAQLGSVLKLSSSTDSFVYEGGRDLTGYEDGTENPSGEKATSVGIIPEGAHQGGALVATLKFEHDFATWESLSGTEQNHAIGRDRESNEELADAPDSAHVKRTAQESYEPEAFILRRSMPWLEGARGGLYFVAFGQSLRPFEAQMARMTGREDGTQDALFRFTRPISGSYFYCPALTADGQSFVGF